MDIKTFWLLVALLFLAVAGKAYSVDDQFVMWLTIVCALFAIVHAFMSKPDKLTFRKLMQLVQPPK